MNLYNNVSRENASRRQATRSISFKSATALPLQQSKTKELKKKGGARMGKGKRQGYPKKAKSKKMEKERRKKMHQEKVQELLISDYFYCVYVDHVQKRENAA